MLDNGGEAAKISIAPGGRDPPIPQAGIETRRWRQMIRVYSCDSRALPILDSRFSIFDFRTIQRPNGSTLHPQKSALHHPIRDIRVIRGSNQERFAGNSATRQLLCVLEFFSLSALSRQIRNRFCLYPTSDGPRMVDLFSK